MHTLHNCSCFSKPLVMDVRRSTRETYPSQKRQENLETEAIQQFWKLFDTFNALLHKTKTKNDLKALKLEVTTAYENVRRKSTKGVDQDIIRCTDRMIEYISGHKMQHDGPTVVINQHHANDLGDYGEISEFDVKSGPHAIPYARSQVYSERLYDRQSLYSLPNHDVLANRPQPKLVMDRYGPPVTKQKSANVAPSVASSSSSKRSCQIAMELYETRQMMAQKDFEREERQHERIERREAFEREQVRLKADILQHQLDAASQCTDRVSDASPPESLHDMGKFVKILADSLSISRLPVPEPPVFSGDVLKYQKWRLSFDALIGSRNISASDKICYLDKYLTGEAKLMVQGTLLCNSDEAYLHARQKLDRRYGDEFIITEAFRDKLKEFPKIQSNDSKALRLFSDLLTEVHMATNNLPGLSILNDCRENQVILQKLPEHLIRKWSRVINVYHRKYSSYPPFAKFTEFIEEESDIVNNPVTCKLLKLSASKPLQTSIKDKSYTHNTSASSVADSIKTEDQVSAPTSEDACLYCKKINNHKLKDCRSFTSLSAEKKNKFVMERGLCYGCLQCGHSSRGCLKKLSCRSCGKRHPTSLHGMYEALNPKANSETEDAQEDTTTLKLQQVQPRANMYSMTIPVYVSSTGDASKEILVYALLDTQSDSSFISKKVADQLKAPCESAKLKVSTMNSTSVNKCKKYTDTFHVRGINLSTRIVIPDAYSIDNIPAHRSQIPTKATAREFPHLRCIQNEMHDLQDCEIGLLLGFDCTRATAPLAFINSGRDEPYALQTEIGWCIVGMNRTPQNKLSESDRSDTPTDQATEPTECMLKDDIKNKMQQDSYQSSLPQKTLPDSLNNKTPAIHLNGLRSRKKCDNAHHCELSTLKTTTPENTHRQPEVNTPEDSIRCLYPQKNGVYHKKKHKRRLECVTDSSTKMTDQ